MKWIRRLQPTLLVFIGVVSVFMTSSVIFDWFGIRAKEGNFVPFIVYTNFICGWIYLFAAYESWKHQWIGVRLLLLASIALIVAFVFLQLHIYNGGLYEIKTVKAMLFRITFTITMTVAGFYLLKHRNRTSKN